jgi:hypothetical protein
MRNKMAKDVKRKIELLMDDVLSIIGNQTANFKTLAETATQRLLTEHEFESMRTQVDLCKSLVKARFLSDLIEKTSETPKGEDRTDEVR